MFQKIKNIIAFFRGYLLAINSKKMSRKRIEKLQVKKFNVFRQKILVNSKYYSQYSQNVLTEYPIINKTIHMGNFDVINTANLRKHEALDIAIQSEFDRNFTPKYMGFSVGLSSGTSGSRGLFVVSEQERSEWVGYIIGKMLPLAIKKHRIAFFLRANNNLYQSANGLVITFKFFDLIDGIEANINELNSYSPSILIAPASVLRRIAESQTTILPRRVISVAEVLEKEDREIIEQRFFVHVEQIYQCTEGFLGSTCSFGNIHLNEDSYIIEKQWLHKSTGRFSPIVTDLRRTTQPIIRYLLDDVLIEESSPCQCGSAMIRIKSIEGRCDDVLQFKGIEGGNIDVFSDYIRNTIISSSDSIKHYRVIQINKSEIIVEIFPYTPELINAVSKRLKYLWQRLSIIHPCCSFKEMSLQFNVDKQRRVVRMYHG